MPPYYSDLLYNDAHQVIQKKTPRKLLKGHHPNALQFSSTYSRFDEGNVGGGGLENHEPFLIASDLAASSFHLFGWTRCTLEDRNLCSQDKPFMLLG
jgi:hypothetical protein